MSPRVNQLSSYRMHRDRQYWYSHRLNRDMGVAANTFFKHPDHVKRSYALSGIYGTHY